MKISFYNTYFQNNLRTRLRSSYAGNFSSLKSTQLQNDTVSFSGRSMLLAENMKDAPSEYLCRKVYDNAEPARYYLQSVLEKYLGPYISESIDTKSEEYPIEKCTTRRKKPLSIREKVVSKYSKKYREESSSFANQVYDEFSQYFKVNTNYDKSTIISAIERTINESSGQRKPLPYKNCAFYLFEVQEMLEKYNYFNFDSESPQNLKHIFSEILDSLEITAPEEDIANLSCLDPTSVSGIKHYAKDIVGARILLRMPEPEYTAVIINALKRAVEDGVINISSVENHVPDPDKLPPDKQISDYIYATDAQLRSLAKASNAQLIKNKSKTGYTAVHINLDLSNDIFKRNNGLFNGYSAEIQIIGSDVEKLKDIEDLCYKLKDNKNAINAAYKPFKDYFLKYYNESTKDAFDDYTYALYLAQRAIPPGTKIGNVFPSLKDLGFDKKLPPELDFNNLRRIKLNCDKEIHRIESEQKLNISDNKKYTGSKKFDIVAIKSFISYLLK